MGGRHCCRPFLRRVISRFAAASELHGWSTLKLDGVCRGGNSLNVPMNCATSACAGTDASRHEHLSRNPDPRLAGVVARLLASAARILRHAAGLRRVALVLWREPVGGPLPDVADHVVHAVAVRRKCRHRRGALEAVLVIFCLGNSPCQVFAMCRPPGVNSSPQANSAPSRPPRAANSHSASVGSACRPMWRRPAHRENDTCTTGWLSSALMLLLGPVGMAPVRALHELPPFAPIAKVDGVLWRCEHQRAGIEHVRQRAGIVFRIGWDLRGGDVTGGADERLELPVCDRRAVNPKAIDGDAVNRRFLRIVLVGAHAERAAGDPDHVCVG